MTSDDFGQEIRNITVRPLRFEDVKKFSSWGHHSDIPFSGYDFPDLASRFGGYFLQRSLWFLSRRFPLLKWLYAIEDGSGNLVGYMKAVRKNVSQRDAEISIVLDPARVEKGYGSEATRQFVEICFQHLNLDEVWLRVLESNTRARRVYEKNAFQYVEIREQPYDDLHNQAELLQRFPEDFFLKNGRLMSRYHYMKRSR